MRYFHTNPNTSWQAAPLLGVKKTTKIRVIVDLGPVNSAKLSEIWSMPNKEAELAEFASCACFATIDFC